MSTVPPLADDGNDEFFDALSQVSSNASDTSKNIPPVQAPDDPFLVRTGATTPASVSSGTWTKIFQDRSLTLATDAQVAAKNLLTVDEESGEAIVYLTWAPKASPGAVSLLQHEFSSERNTTYFVGAPSVDADLKNTANVGDGFKSGVMLRRPASDVTLSLWTAILPAFGIDSMSHPLFMSLLTALDTDQPSKQVLTAQPADAPDWAFTITTTGSGVNTKIVQSITLPPHLGQGVNVLARTPTDAIWCVCQDGLYSVVTAVTYNLRLKLAELKAWVSSNFGAFVPSAWATSSATTLIARLTITQTAVYTPDTLAMKKGPLGNYYEVINLAFDLSNMTLHLRFDQDSMQALLLPSGSSESISTMINSALSGSGLSDNLDMLPSKLASNLFTDMFSHVFLWHISVAKGFGIAGDSTSLLWNFALYVAVPMANNQHAIVTLMYDSQSKTFTGVFVPKDALSNTRLVRAATWDPRLDLLASLQSNQLFDTMVNDIDILQVVGGTNDDCPLPLTLKGAGVTFTRGISSASFRLSIYGNLGQPSAPTSVPPMPFKWDSARVSAIITKVASKTVFDITLLNTFVLTGKAPSGQVAPSVAFSTLLRYQNLNGTQVTFSASASRFKVATIESLFDEDTSEGAMAVIGNLTLAQVTVDYTFQQKKAASFIMSGILMLGELQLDLKYKYPDASSTDSKWTFTAELRPTSLSSTVASIVESIVPGASDSLPDFVGSIPVSPVASQGAAPLVLFEMKSLGTKQAGTTTILTVWIAIGGLSLTFIQYRTQAASAGTTSRKRILRVSVDQIPMMDKIPIVGQMPQPFDHLIYMWVGDDSANVSPNSTTSPPDPTTLGFTKGELVHVQALIPVNVPTLQVKATAPEKAEALTPTNTEKAPTTSRASTPADIGLASGHHFVVVVHGQVVLDHVFNTSKADSVGGASASTSPPTGSGSGTGSGGTSSGGTGSGGTGSGGTGSGGTVAENNPTKGDTTTSAGPLSISALTLQYKHGRLIVTLDATLKLGPLTFSVIGFSLEINLSGVKLDHLADIVTQGLVSASLHGMEVGVAQGPLTLKGVFIHDKTAAGESYRGGIAIGFKAWQVLAIGEYFVHLDSKGNEDYKAVFVYGKVDGPLIELEFATISGVRVGFGYNYGVRMPGINELTSFPLISDSGISGQGNDPGAILEAFRGGTKPFVFVRKGSAWFAVGMTITAFDLLTLTAVLVLDIDNGESDPKEAGVIIAMFADGVFQMEPLVEPEMSLFYVELVIAVELNFVHDYIAANAALAPASHLYVPMCHLAGQASFYSWFGRNPHAGDWVASIGGYARAYKPPPWYPVPERVSLTFTVGDCIHIVGTAYCAVTPKCAMAGGTLHLSLDVGPVSAYADLIFDAFINFQPFHFTASMSISVGVSCGIDIGLIHIHLSISLGADLVIWGPHDFGGRAHVDFWFFGFDISFGALEDPSARQAIDLLKFLEMVDKPGPVGDKDKPHDDSVGVPGGTTTRHKYSVEQGLSPQTIPPPTDTNNYPSTGALSEWHVLGGSLQFRIDCGFTLSGATMTRLDEDTNQQIDSPILLPSGSPAPDVYSWPMHSTDKINSTIKITITKGNATQELVSNFKAELVLKSASAALWSKWDPNLDPLHPSPTNTSSDHLNDPANGTIPLVQAVRIMAPAPQRAKSRIIDFDATAAMKFTIPDSPALPLTETQLDALRPSYFEAVDDKGNAVNALQRWSDLEDVWLGQSDATVPEEDIRASLATMVADVLEWKIRPPEQMAKNVPTAPAATVLVGGAVAPVSVANTVMVNTDGRQEWELVSEPPLEMLSLLDEYFPMLPFVCA